MTRRNGDAQGRDIHQVAELSDEQTIVDGIERSGPDIVNTGTPNVGSFNAQGDTHIHIRLLVGQCGLSLINPIHAVGAAESVNIGAGSLKPQPGVRIGGRRSRAAPTGSRRTYAEALILFVAI